MITIAKKIFLASAVALPLIAASVSAHAESTISDRQYIRSSNNNLPSPFDQTIVNNGSNRSDALNYIGGPKTGIRSHR